MIRPPFPPLMTRTLVVGAVSLSLTVGIVIILMSMAFGDGACMTKREARAAHPNEYLAYRTTKGRRCWFAPARPKVEEAPPAPMATQPSPRWIVVPDPWDRGVWYPPQRLGDIDDAWSMSAVYSTFDVEPEIW